jgi:hypothetical protein
MTFGNRSSLFKEPVTINSLFVMAQTDNPSTTASFLTAFSKTCHLKLFRIVYYFLKVVGIGSKGLISECLCPFHAMKTFNGSMAINMETKPLDRRK